jgi:hypothetical protein
MGITARGAWELVKKHFRDLGRDTQIEDFTVVGVGDMSGDAFGNGMLLSEHIRLVSLHRSARLPRRASGRRISASVCNLSWKKSLHTSQQMPF